MQPAEVNPVSGTAVEQPTQQLPVNNRQVNITLQVRTFKTQASLSHAGCFQTANLRTSSSGCRKVALCLVWHHCCAWRMSSACQGFKCQPISKVAAGTLT